MGIASLERDAVKLSLLLVDLFLSSLLAGGVCSGAEPPQNAVPREAIRPQTTLILVVGAAGEESYGKIFAEELASWRQIASTSDVELFVVGDAADKQAAVPDKEQLHELLAQQAAAANVDGPLWLVLIGHGTFDGRTAAFNLRGPDVTSAELVEWLKNDARPTAIINTTAASAPFLTALSGPRRVIVTATKSGQERNYARFGRYFAQRVIDSTADLDKDEQTSLLEAYLAAARDTAEFYKQDGRIATEHPLLDDDGDGRGVPAGFFEQGRLKPASAAGKTADGELARTFCLHPSTAERNLSVAQTGRRDELEAELAALRLRRSELSDPDYFAELERILTALARLYADAQP